MCRTAPSWLVLVWWLIGLPNLTVVSKVRALTMPVFPPSNLSMTVAQQQGYRETVREMFHHAMNGYMEFAFPADEVRPVTCTPLGPSKDNVQAWGINDVLGDYSLTLVDSLDTFAVLGDKVGFAHAVRLIREHVRFDRDSNVQVFEVTIRVLGGLLGGHLLATDPNLGMQMEDYNDELLDLAHDLGKRLLPAFTYSPTNLPCPRVNLKRGPFITNPMHTCTAAAGTLILEFGILSRLTGDSRFEQVARASLRRLWSMRSKYNLFGNTIDYGSSTWQDPTATVGAGVDSLYEYLLKAAILFDDDEYLGMFNQAYTSVIRYLTDKTGYAFFRVDIHTLALRSVQVDSLSAFFPGLQVLAGDLEFAIRGHLLYYNLWRKYHAMPEIYNLYNNEVISSQYPLRPEFIESTYHLYRATGDPFYLQVGAQIIKDLNTFNRVQCGFSTMENIHTKVLGDRMESFFISETLKYLYLLFDERNPFNSLDTAFVFTTEAHMLYLPRGLRKSGSKIRIPTSRFSSRAYQEFTCPRPDQFTMNPTDPASPLSIPGSVAYRPDLEWIRHELRRPDLRFNDQIWYPTSTQSENAGGQNFRSSNPFSSLSPFTIEPLTPDGICLRNAPHRPPLQRQFKFGFRSKTAL
ncbi:hypothetical protein IWQ61_003857 [Dispira simplex]|nr:hypothetical protein IWQ61_003857 [Dispira simplex]